MGVLNLYACIGYPQAEDEYLTKNSAQFHEHLGFTLAGTFHNCGYKFGRWYDMIWMEKVIGEHRPISRTSCRINIEPIQKKQAHPLDAPAFALLFIHLFFVVLQRVQLIIPAMCGEKLLVSSLLQRSQPRDSTMMLSACWMVERRCATMSMVPTLRIFSSES